MITVKADVRSARDYLNLLERRELPRVIGRSLTRAASAAKTFSSRTLRERINLKKRVIDEAIRTRRSGEVGTITALTTHGPWFEIRWTGKPFPLRDYDARPNTRKGVTFKVSRRGARKVYRRAGRLGFIVAKLGGHVFVRVGQDPPGPKKAGIKKVYGPSIPQFALTQQERARLIEHVLDFYQREFIRNANFALQRRGKT
jgi:hypothetical protein